MKVSINWIKDFVDLSGLDINALISNFTMSVAEVENVEYKGKGIEGVITARITEVSDVPNSKKLHVLKVDTGEETLQIVCGAQNVRKGQVTALAKIGAKLGNVTISKETFMGIDSYGMCCAPDEIGASNDHSGILDLGDNVPIGVDIKNILPIEDTIFEIDNKSISNRPDLWGHYGIAREISALTGRPLKPLPLESLKSFKDLEKADINIKTDGCYRYTSACMKNITRKESPLKMQIRLFYCGMRGLNLLADVTNYVMLELGQPMHAFDNDVVKKVEVYDLKEDTTFKTLDTKERTLHAGSMVIATNGEPVAIAGVMGGENSEITNDTTSVLIESANFDAYKIRTTALSLGLRTEASTRYEKSLDPELTLTSLLRYIYIIKSLDEGASISSSICDIYTKRYPKIKVSLSKKYIDDFIGFSIPKQRILKILRSLGFKSLISKIGEFRFLVPSFRATKDVMGKADIIEEITRIYGYGNIPPKSISQVLKPALLPRALALEYDTKHTLAERYNMHEVHTYLWYDEDTNKLFNINPPSYVRCINSINKENDKIRSTIIPSLLKVVLDNKGFSPNFGVFEIARIVTGKDEKGLANEQKSLGIVVKDSSSNYSDTMLKLKEILNYLFSYVFKLDLALEPSSPIATYYTQKNYYKIHCGSTQVGNIFILSPAQSEKIEEGCTVVGCEINFSSLLGEEEKETTFKEISKFPTTKLDFNFIVPIDKLYKDIIVYAKSVVSDLNYKVDLVDIYDNKDTTKSYTLRYEVNSLTKNLTSDDIEKFHKDVIKTFEDKGIKLKS